MTEMRISLVFATCAACGGGGDVPDGSTAGSADAPADPGPGEPGMWTDAPGECPPGTTRADIRTAAELHDAARGDGPIATCYFLHDGTYLDDISSPHFYVTRGGTETAPIYFVGESRAGVIIKGRASIAMGTPYITISNMTFDLTGYTKTGSYNTISVLADHVALTHLTVTGDCMTGHQGGAIEVDGGHRVLIEANLIEKFGQCTTDPHLDHGVYLGSGGDITVRNNVIRGNASRGIQLNTERGQFGTLDTILIERNRITANGHGDYEDGIVLNGDQTGTISGVTIRRNLIYANYYAGIRFVGNAINGVVVEHNTFAGNGTRSSLASRSEINLDGGTPGAMVRKNLVVAQRALINTCAGAITLDDNAVMGPVSGACVTNTVVADPQFVDAANGDFHPGNTAVAAYGAYAP